MPNPMYAFPNTRCEECGERIGDDNSVYFHEGAKLCEGCAEEEGVVCPECGQYKKDEFKTCYECSQA